VLFELLALGLKTKIGREKFAELLA